MFSYYEDWDDKGETLIKKKEDERGEGDGGEMRCQKVGVVGKGVTITKLLIQSHMLYTKEDIHEKILMNQVKKCNKNKK